MLVRKATKRVSPYLLENSMSQVITSQSEEQPGDTPLAAIFRHNLWANLRLFDACAALSQEQLAATTAGTYGAVYDTLRHLVRAESNYLNHITHRRQGTPLGWDDNPTIEALREYVRQSGEGLIAFANGTAASESMPMEWDGQRRQVPLSHILTQAINHATEHRAQVMTIMTQQGVEPPDLSGWGYIDERVSFTLID
jgi:uncharacterized damage-inducible protein DinB